MVSDESPTRDERLPSIRSLNGQRLTALRALRKVLTVSLLDAPVDKRAPLALQLRATLAEIDGLSIPKPQRPKVKEGDEIDEVARRRALRRGDPAPELRSTGE